MSENLPLPNSIFAEDEAPYPHGLPRENCPYTPGSDEREPWLAGWDQAAQRDSAGRDL